MLPEDRQEIEQIIDQKILEFALKLPDIISNLVMESTAKFNLYKDFLTDNKGLYERNPDLVSKIIMETEGKNPGKSYIEILKLATPLIKERLDTMKGLDFTKTEKPKDLTFKVDLGEL